MSHGESCPRCGTTNAPGSIFCTNCGGILSSLTDVQKRIRRRRFHPRLDLVVVLAALVLCAVAVLALWPHRVRIGRVGNPDAGRRVSQGLRMLHTMDGAFEVGRAFSEAEVNGYIEHLRLEGLGYEVLSLKLLPRKVQLRVVKRLGPWTFAGLQMAPRISQDYMLALDGMAVAVEQASLGHLPLPPSLARRAFGRLANAMRGEREMRLLAGLRRIEIDRDRLHLVVGGE